MATSSGGLSREEFLRLQEQLIELRNANYELKEKLKTSNFSNNESLSKKDPLQFASRLLNRSLTEREKETQQRLEAENGDLRAKLLQQEDEFRLQQQTFIEELNKVVRQCEELQKELNGKKEGISGDPLELTSVEDLEKEKKGWMIKKEELERKLDMMCKRETELEKESEEQRACVSALESTILDLRKEIDDLTLKKKEAEEKGEEEAAETLKMNRSLEQEVADLKKDLERGERRYQSELEKERENLAKAKKGFMECKGQAESSSREMDQLRGLLSTLGREKESFESKLEEMTAAHQAELDTFSKSHEEELRQERIKWDFVYNERMEQLRDQLLQKERNQGEEVKHMRETFQREKEAMEKRIDDLERRIGAKDEEKHIALKKQNLLVKELQKALKEEKRRAESVEKVREKEWHVVDPDARSSNTYDGNESISSLSALESDNFELINKLGALQKAYADAADKVRHLEHENECQQKEILEKGEVIENWIRSRPMAAVSGVQKNENPLRKFLTTTLASDEVVMDLREMNRKLQRMLEETLSKNIILQRDLQTLLERTEM